jgi:hypothetical protein
MVARPSVIFGDGTKNFLDGDLVIAALRSNRKVDVFVFRVARQIFSCVHPPTHGGITVIMAGFTRRVARSRWRDDCSWSPHHCVRSTIGLRTDPYVVIYVEYSKKNLRVGGRPDSIYVCMRLTKIPSPRCVEHLFYGVLINTKGVCESLIAFRLRSTGASPDVHAVCMREEKTNLQARTGESSLLSIGFNLLYSNLISSWQKDYSNLLFVLLRDVHAWSSICARG